jgi:hypothetical protein
MMARIEYLPRKAHGRATARKPAHLAEQPSGRGGAARLNRQPRFPQRPSHPGIARLEGVKAARRRIEAALRALPRSEDDAASSRIEFVAFAHERDHPLEADPGDVQLDDLASRKRACNRPVESHGMDRTRRRRQ